MPVNKYKKRNQKVMKRRTTRVNVFKSKFVLISFVCLFAVGGIYLLLKSRAATGLTWAPPSGWQNYTRFPATGSVTGGKYTLPSDSTDYQIVLPATQTTTGIQIVGGRNIVFVHDDGSGGTKLGGVISVGSQWNTGYDNAAVVIDDGANSPVGRIVHIEGVKLTGSWLGDGFQIRAPKAIVQIENVWIDVQHGDYKC
jgi:hypothetical protein